MKKIYFYLFTILSLSCTKSEKNAEIQYYIKYEVNGKVSPQTATSNGLKITLNTEYNNTVDYIASSSIFTTNEYIVGPVSKGFTATLKVKNNAVNNYMKPVIRIYIGENNKYFYVKKEDSATSIVDSALISYKIQ